MMQLTLDILRTWYGATITNAQAANVLKMNPARLAQYAREGRLGWSTTISGNRVLHSREDFIRYWSGEPKPEPKRPTDDLLEELIQLIRVQNGMLMELLANVKAPPMLEHQTERTERRDVV